MSIAEYHKSTTSLTAQKYKCQTHVDLCGVKGTLGTDWWPSVDGNFSIVAAQHQTLAVVGNSEADSQ